MCKNAGTSRGDRPFDCSASYNQYIWDMDPDRDQKIHVAKIMNPKFDELDEIEQEEEISSIVKFPLIPRLYSIRFRSLYTRLD